MSAEIVQFNRPVDASQYILVCNCGCASFELRGDGFTLCRNCRSVMDNQDHRKWFKTEHDGETEQAHFSDGGNNSTFAERSAKRNAQGDEVTWLVCGDDGGAVRAWAREYLETPEQQEWLQRQVGTGIALILKDKPE